MPKSSIDPKFLTDAWALLDHAHIVDVQCCLIWRLNDDEDFTCASTLKSSEVRALLLEVLRGNAHDIESCRWLPSQRTK